jgi:hypothetical protein
MAGGEKMRPKGDVHVFNLAQVCSAGTVGPVASPTLTRANTSIVGSTDGHLNPQSRWPNPRSLATSESPLFKSCIRKEKKLKIREQGK